MALTPLFQRYDFTDANLNAVLQDYRLKMNDVIKYFLDTDFGSLALYDTDQSDILSLKWNEDDSNPRTLNLKVNSADRTISMSGNLTVEGASLINSDLTTDAMWSTSGGVSLRSNAELRFYDNGNYVGFEAPALGADCIWVLPTADGAAGEHMVSDGSKTLSWTTGAGTGDVSAAANITDHAIVRGNGGAKGVQTTGIIVDDSDNVSFPGKIILGTPTEITLVSNAVTVTKSYHKIDTEDDDPIDSLQTINGGTEGMILIITPEHDDRTISVLDADSGGDNIYVNGRATFTMDKSKEKLLLISDGTDWFELGRFSWT